MHQKTTRPVTLLTETFAYRGAEWHRKSLGTTGLLYDGDNVLADLDGSTVSRFYVTPMLDQNVSMTITGGDQAGTYWYSQDERQSVRTLTDSTGAIVARYDYTAFGEPVACSPSPVVQQRYTYTGRELNPQSGNFCFRYRTYDPTVGIFTARDPLGYVDGMGLYGGRFSGRFAIDPSGRQAANAVFGPQPNWQPVPHHPPPPISGTQPQSETADEWRPCCCPTGLGPGRGVSASAVASAPNLAYVELTSLTMSGCYANLRWFWWSCSFGPHPGTASNEVPWGQQFGHELMHPEHNPTVFHLTVEWLSCESMPTVTGGSMGVWRRKWARALAGEFDHVWLGWEPSWLSKTTPISPPHAAPPFSALW